jgi:hypothetical protein
MAGCSKALVIRWRGPGGAASMTPVSAILSASVPLAVNSRGDAWNSAADGALQRQHRQQLRHGGGHG